MFESELHATIDEVAAGTYRISVAVPPGARPGGFSYNQYLILDDEPLLFHTGPRRTFPLVRDALRRVMPVERLRWISFSHVEADECGALNEWLAAAPEAAPLCSRIAARVSIGDMADRPPRALADGEVIDLGSHRLRWLDAPHMPHAWESGLPFDETTRTLFCGDLFTQPGHDTPPLTTGDILGPSEAFRAGSDYFSQTRQCSALIEKLAATQPGLLACMHGSAWEGDGAGLLRELGAVLDR